MRPMRQVPFRRKVRRLTRANPVWLHGLLSRRPSTCGGGGSFRPG